MPPHPGLLSKICTMHGKNQNLLVLAKYFFEGYPFLSIDPEMAAVRVASFSAGWNDAGG